MGPLPCRQANFCGSPNIIASKIIRCELKKAIDDYHNYAPGTTKRIKSKPERTDEELEVINLPSEKRYDVNTKIFKVFDGAEYKGSVTGYNTQTKLLYHIKYEDGDTKDMYQSEVKGYHHANVKRLPKRKRWK